MANKNIRIQRLTWTITSFITFGIFVFAITSKTYWLNIFVIILGLLIKEKGYRPLFSENEKKRAIIKRELIESHVIKSKSYLKKGSN